jgi:uroporphyrinogen decarboxylase
MTPREKFINALTRGKPEGRVPHFELVFFLTMEVFGKVHPRHRSYHQWDQMTAAEQALHIDDMAELFIAIARRFEHSAIFVNGPEVWGNDRLANTVRVLEAIRKKSGDTYFLMIHGDATYDIPSGERMQEFICQIADNPDGLKRQAQKKIDDAIARAEKLKSFGLLDGFGMCCDYCLNDGPFLSPAMFGEFDAPYLKQLIAAYRQMGYYTIKHTDGNIMPILDYLVDANPHAIHSLDPQGGVDIAEIKRRVGKRVCLIGNVNCGLMDTGTDQEVIDSARYALEHGMPGGGYIFSTSNCIYSGMRLERYELIRSIWKEFGNYQ